MWRLVKGFLKFRSWFFMRRKECLLSGSQDRVNKDQNRIPLMVVFRFIFVPKFSAYFIQMKPIIKDCGKRYPPR